MAFGFWGLTCGRVSELKDRMKEKRRGGKDKKKKDSKSKLYVLGLLFVTCVRCTMFDVRCLIIALY